MKLLRGSPTCVPVWWYYLVLQLDQVWADQGQVFSWEGFVPIWVRADHPVSSTHHCESLDHCGADQSTHALVLGSCPDCWYTWHPCSPSSRYRANLHEVVFQDITSLHHLYPEGFSVRSIKSDAVEEEALTQTTTMMTQLLSRLASFRGILKGFMISDDVPNDSCI
jgi:hypothetical protein